MRKKILIGAAAALALVLAAGGAFLFAPSKKITVAFYRVDDRQRVGITEVINKIAGGKKLETVYIQYSPEKSLESQLLLAKKPDIVVTVSGYAVSSAVDKASKKAGISNDCAQGMTSSMRSAIRQRNSKIAALPVLSSHLEADIDTQGFRGSGVEKISAWSDVEKFLLEQKGRGGSPMIFAGGDSGFLIDMTGALAESLDGISSYTGAARILAESGRNFSAAEAAAALCDGQDSPLAAAVGMLRNWYARGLIHADVFSFNEADVSSLAESEAVSMMLMPLETHRDFPQRAISRFTSIYFPSERVAVSRVFTGKTYYAVPMRKSAGAETLLAELVGAAEQENLSRATGLAPVLAQCRTPDKQADDARYWIAATSAPLAGLSSEIYLTEEQKKELAEEIAARIRF